MSSPESQDPGPSGAPTSAPSAARSQAEQSTTARIGAVLFRNRSWLPVPFLIVTLLAPSNANWYNWLVGLVLIVIGESIRLAGVAVAGTVTRRRSRDVQRLVNYGVFAWVRNPLYVGNFLIWMGFVVISGVWWFLPLAIVIFGIEYSLIVAYEEGVLESIFGADYLTYKRTTPRWLPRPPRERVAEGAGGEHNWKEAWRSEISTFMQYGALIVVFAVKQKIWWS
jgi:protein-S-isoprenylcysteine O-methyltransferase Ste14